MPVRILFLFSDTGGGHRSAAEAIRDAMYQTWPGRADVEMVDFYTQAFPPPLNRSGSLYSPIVSRANWLMAGLWRTFESPKNLDRLWRGLKPTTYHRFVALLERHAADVVVSVHPFACHFMALAAHALPRPIPALTIVTDLVNGPTFWFDPNVDFIYVPTEPSQEKAIQLGVSPDKVEVVGQPVNPRFKPFVGDRAKLREQLGLVPDRPTIVIVGGGEGMGDVYGTARAVATSGLPIQLVIIAGRNAPLKERLAAVQWEVPTIVNGFVTNMPEWMAAADILVTKAGPGAIAEALILGLPMILFSFVPWETHNIDWVLEQGVGVVATTPATIVSTLRQWLTPGNPALDEMAHKAHRLARPKAAYDLAERILAFGEAGR